MEEQSHDHSRQDTLKEAERVETYSSSESESESEEQTPSEDDDG